MALFTVNRAFYHQPTFCYANAPSLTDVIITPHTPHHYPHQLKPLTDCKLYAKCEGVRVKSKKKLFYYSKSKTSVCYSCSQTLCRYRRHTARWVEVFISWHICRQVERRVWSSGLAAISSSRCNAALVAITLSVRLPREKSFRHFTGEATSVSTR